jgi:hypothetical protein
MDFSSLLKANTRFFFRGNEIKSEVNGNAHKVIGEIRPCFEGKQNLHELIFDLQAKLEPYKYWDESDFRKRVNDFIIKESANKCSIHLGEEDLRVLWL